MKNAKLLSAPVNGQLAAQLKGRNGHRGFLKAVSGIFSFTFFMLGIALIMVGLEGCKKDNDIKQTTPFTAEFETVSSIVQQGPPEVDLINGKGYGTPIGKSSFVVHAQFDDKGILTGTIVATTADGDQLLATINGQNPDINADGDITLHFDSKITGGTGKFANATGSFSGIAHESIYTAAGAASWDGSITY